MDGLVSVIIPNFNNAQWLPKCIKSCFEQDFLQEVIVVDDGSTDNSWEVLQRFQQLFPAKVKVYNNPGKGANEARNFGFYKSSGDYIQWLDADDFLVPDKFRKQIETMERENADIAYCGFRFDFYENGIFKGSESIVSRQYNDFLEEILKDNWLASHCYLLKRDIAKKLEVHQGWNPQTKVGQDREYFTLAALLGSKFVYTPGCYAIYNRWSLHTISGMDFNRRLELNQILESRFREYIIKGSFTAKKKKTYVAIMNTHKLKACFYNPNVQFDNLFSLLDVKWNLIHYKMRTVIPIIYLIKIVKYFCKRSIG